MRLLLALLAVVVLGASCSSGENASGDGDNPDGGNSSDGSGGGNGEVAMRDFDAGTPVSLKLSAGDPGETEAVVPTEVVTGTLLDADDIARVVDRLPAWSEIVDDVEDFKRPVETLPPPLVGETIDAPFPPDGGGDEPPEVADGPLEVVRFQPEGEVLVAPYFSVTFNQPMVPLATLEALDELDVPVRVSPEIEGRWQWVGTKTLRFESTSELFDRLPMATDFTVEVPAGTTSETGGELAEAVSFTFSTPPAGVMSVTPSRDNSVPTDQIFVAVFDQRVDPADALAAVDLKVAAEDLAVRLATEDEIAQDEDVAKRVEGLLDGRWIAFRAEQEMEPNSAIVITVGPDVPSAEGPRVNEKAKTFRARTYAPLKVEGQSCQGANRCEPGQSLSMWFNNELDVGDFDVDTITVSPEISGQQIFANPWEISIRGATKGQTTYTVTLPAELTDTFGQTLGSDTEIEFKIRDAEPWLREFNQPLITLDPLAENPTLPILTVNHDDVDIEAYSVDPQDWNEFQNYLEGQWEENPRPIPAGWDRVASFNVDIAAKEDELTETSLDLSAAFAGQPGHRVVVVKPTGRLADLNPQDDLFWRNRPAIAWVQSTNIAVDAISDSTQLVAWITDLSTGAPLEGVEVELRDGALVGEDSSDGSGLATITLARETANRRPQLVASLGDDTAFISGWWSSREMQDTAIWYVFDDRQTYKPGETARVKGWVRGLSLGSDAQLGLFGPDAKVRYAVTDRQGNELAAETLEIDALGGFDLSIDIPEAANSGQAVIHFVVQGVPNLQGGRSDHRHSFQIQDFRRPEFEVTASTITPAPHILGAPATVGVEANYFSGGPLPGAPVDWQVTTSTASYTPPNNPDFSFGIWRPWWFGGFDEGFGGRFGGGFGGGFDDDFGFGGFGPEEEPKVERFSGVTNGGGDHFVQIDFEGEGDGQPTSVSAQASVTDVNRQQWSSTTNMLVHPGEYYVGLRSDRTYVREGEPLEIELIVVDIDGEAAADRPMTVEAGRLEGRFENGEWTNEPVDIQTCDVTSTNNGPVTCSFDTEGGGEFRISAVVADDAGNASRSQLTRWVSGGDRQPVRNVELEDLILVPDAETYAPGDTAEILVQSPIDDGEGLITLARNGVIDNIRFEVADGTGVAEIPITDDHIPNLHVQIDVVGASDRVNDQGDPIADAPDRPAFATARMTLSVPPAARTLEVTATPADEFVIPGNDTSLEVTVTDADGQALADANLAVVVADEAILALSNYELPDPLDIFYRPIPADIRTDYSRNTVVLTNPDDLFGSDGERVAQAGGGGGDGDDEAMEEGDAAFSTADAALEPQSGPVTTTIAANRTKQEGNPDSDGGDPNIEVRENFNALAVFAPDVTTDANGKATIDVPLPDSLTRYRVMVVAVDGVDRFGSGESNITARLPLMVRPSAPRFLNFGDTFELPVVVQNQTDDDLEVDVAIETSNLTLTDGAGRRVSVPANDRREVRFPAEAANVGTASFRVAAAAGDLGDAAITTLPVYTPVTTEAFATYGVVDDGTVLQTVQPPEGVVPQFGGLEVNTSSTALQALTDTLIYVEEYDYATADGFASRIMTIAALREVLEAFDAKDVPTPAEFEAVVASDIENLVQLQNNDGGFSYWRRDGRSSPYVSIQAAHAMVLARDAGYAVPDQAFDRAQGYLSDIRNRIPNDWPQEVRWALTAYALHVRFLAGDRDTDAATELYNRAADEMELDAIAALWPVIDDQAIRDEIARLFANRANENAGAATFTTDYGEDAYLILASDRRTDGVILNSLITEDPDNGLIPKVVAGLLGNQRRNTGRWANIQENTFILLALKNYFDTFEAQDPDFVARIWLGDLYAGEHEYQGRVTDRNETTITMAELIDGAGDDSPLVLSKEGVGRLYYRLGLDYAPDDLELDALDRGFVVEREYFAVDDVDDVSRDDDGTWRIKAGANIRIRLTMVADSRRTHVMLIDPLAAGLESLNPELAVTGDFTPAIDLDAIRAALAEEGFDVDGMDDEDIRQLGEEIGIDPTVTTIRPWWRWYEHENLRDDRTEAYASLVGGGVYEYTYLARATTPGDFVVPPAKAEEIYAPETFGRSASDKVVIE